MDRLRVREDDDGLSVASDFWEVRHLRRCGGAWSSIVFGNGSGKNLLRGPACSSVRVNRSDAGVSGFFSEANERQPRLNWESLPGGSVVVTTEGTYRDGEGTGIPVGYRRRTEYLAHGMIAVTLQLMSDCGCSGVVEVRALDLPLRAGLTDGYVRFHPTQAGSADLLGGRAWLDLSRPGAATPFLSRFTPLQVACFERGVEGIEVFTAAELLQWDFACKPDMGLGLYRVGRDDSGSTIELAPYCLTSRRIRTRIQGTTSLRQTFFLPEVKARTPKPALQHRFLKNLNTTDAEIEQLAAEGVGLVCFKCDSSDDGKFWRNGAVTPFDADGMGRLRGIIESCHRCRIKIVPYISTHELHPETHAYEVHAREWMHCAARSLDAIHNWNPDGEGESGALMCLSSGWLHYRKATIDAILDALPWDGVCLDWPSVLPCCHPGHAHGPFHAESDGMFDLLFHCRKRVGPQGVLAFLAAPESSIAAMNLADHVLRAEDGA